MTRAAITGVMMMSLGIYKILGVWSASSSPILCYRSPDSELLGLYLLVASFHHQTPIAQVIWGMHRCTSADKKQTADGNQSLHIAALSNIEDDVLSHIAKLSVLTLSFVCPARIPISPVDRRNVVHLRQKVELL